MGDALSARRSDKEIRHKRPIQSIVSSLHCTVASKQIEFDIPLRRMTNDANQSQGPLYNEVARVIELIRPSIQADGGDIELVSVDEDGVVSVRFLGACIGCPSLDMTLQGGVEVMIKSRVDDVTAVQPVE